MSRCIRSILENIEDKRNNWWHRRQVCRGDQSRSQSQQKNMLRWDSFLSNFDAVTHKAEVSCQRKAFKGDAFSGVKPKSSCFSPLTTFYPTLKKIRMFIFDRTCKSCFWSLPRIFQVPALDNMERSGQRESGSIWHEQRECRTITNNSLLHPQCCTELPWKPSPHWKVLNGTFITSLIYALILHWTQTLYTRRY